MKKKSEMAKDLNKYYQPYSRDLEDLSDWCFVNVTNRLKPKRNVL